MRLVEYIRKRPGMFVPTARDGRPERWVWENLLHELVADGVESFRRGEATHLVLHSEDGYGIGIGHDGRLCTGGVEDVLEPADGGCTPGVYSRFGTCRYALAAALAERMEIAAGEGGEWQSVECRRGVPGLVQRLLPGTAGTGKGVWIAFAPKAEYLPGEQWEEAVFAEEGLQRFGEALACGNPGLRVSVDGREHWHPGGIEGVVAGPMEAAGTEVLAPPRAVEVRGAAFAWGAVRRREPGRRLAGRVFLHGREARRRSVLGKFESMVVDGLCGSRFFPEGPCTVFFAFSMDIPEGRFESPMFSRRVWDSGASEWVDEEMIGKERMARCCFARAAQCLARELRRERA